MLGAQRAMTDEEITSTADPVGLKNEHQRWVNNAAAGVTEGGKATVSGAGRAGFTFGDPNAAFGHTWQFAAQWGWEAAMGASRKSSANVGGGEVRGLLY